MHKITVRNVSPLDAVDMKLQLLRAGLVMDDDFTWRYVPIKWDNFTGLTGLRYVEFEFRDSTLATFYQLKWT